MKAASSSSSSAAESDPLEALAHLAALFPDRLPGGTGELAIVLARHGTDVREAAWAVLHGETADRIWDGKWIPPAEEGVGVGVGVGVGEGEEEEEEGEAADDPLTGLALSITSAANPSPSPSPARASPAPPRPRPVALEECLEKNDDDHDDHDGSSDGSRGDEGGLLAGFPPGGRPGSLLAQPQPQPQQPPQLGLLSSPPPPPPASSRSKARRIKSIVRRGARQVRRGGGLPTVHGILNEMERDYMTAQLLDALNRETREENAMHSMVREARGGGCA